MLTESISLGSSSSIRQERLCLRAVLRCAELGLPPQVTYVNKKGFDDVGNGRFHTALVIESDNG